ncbi:LytTR family DNA-binding domain-containing protein [Bradyrhizobium sp. HKCCYLRH3059]|uniref:LytTR family DNA-binding domain-containing protein n=1 Tax=Bradyrhizobium sp. HKCCYLRH3059 TaxID=3420745 RepID=UPI003EB76086
MNKLVGSMLRPNDRTFYAIMAGLSLGIGVVNALSAAHDAVRLGAAYDLEKQLLWEMTSIVVLILLAPLLVATVRSIRLGPATMARHIALAIAAVVAFSALHMIGMVTLRKLLMWTAGGAYDFQLSLATIVYEFRKDVMTALLIGATLWLYDGYRASAVREPTRRSEPPAPATLWLRDGASRIRISPADILWVAAAGNYVEYAMADGRRHLIRGTLSAAEVELARFALVRIHRGRLVNMARVAALSVLPTGDFGLTFDNGQSAQGSRRYRSAVAQLEQTASLR